jgi:hypothetical protein
MAAASASEGPTAQIALAQRADGLVQVEIVSSGTLGNFRLRDELLTPSEYLSHHWTFGFTCRINTGHDHYRYPTVYAQAGVNEQSETIGRRLLICRMAAKNDAF